MLSSFLSEVRFALRPFLEGSLKRMGGGMARITKGFRNEPVFP